MRITSDDVRRVLQTEIYDDKQFSTGCGCLDALIGLLLGESLVWLLVWFSRYLFAH